MRSKVCCFTGHRPQSLPWKRDEGDLRCVALKAELQRQIRLLAVERGVVRFISGMAQGVDIWAAEAVLALREELPIQLECALPCEAQTEPWSKVDQERHRGIVERCDWETVVQNHYSPDCFQRRNRYMIDHSDYVLAVWNGRMSSGTGATLAYAQEKGKEIVLIRV